MRIALLLMPSATEPGRAHVSGLTAEIMRWLREGGARVEVIVPEHAPLDVAAVRPVHDLYVLKSKSPLSLSLAGVLALRGAHVVNSADATRLTRDKIAATAVIAAAGAPVPPSWATGRPALLAPLLESGGLWVKPSRGSRGEGVQLVGRPTDLASDSPVDRHGLPLPLFAQRNVPADCFDLKVYVIGDRVFAIRRRFPARTLEEKIGTPATPPPDVDTAARLCGRALGLELYGVDVVMAEGGFYVVDVNAFPGYKGVTEAPGLIAAHLYACAGGARERATA